MNVVILRRDLRLEDNWVFYQVAQSKKPFAVIFIYNKKQIDKKHNKYFSQNGLDFLNHALDQLSKKINLNIYQSNNDVAVLKTLHQKHLLTNIYVSQDLTTFAHEREAKIAQFCQREKINFHSHEDYFALHPRFIQSPKESAYQVFKPFYHKYLAQIVDIKTWKYPKITKRQTLKLNANTFACDLKPVSKPIKLPHSAKQVWAQLAQQQNYAQKCNILIADPSLISAALKFGLVSFRMVLLKAVKLYGLTSELVRQLIWKEFYYHYYFYHRHHYLLRGSYPTNIISKYDHWKYHNNSTWFTKWKTGSTGILLIDAAMHQLNTTGYMHNRARMIVASFLVKNLNIDWRLGERYFATKLYDYDPIINNQSWQWSGFSGLNFQGNIRVFSPILQQKKYDPKQLYCQKYLDHTLTIKPLVDLSATRNEFLKKWKEFQ